MALHNLKIVVVNGGREIGEFGSSLNKSDKAEKSDAKSKTAKILSFNESIKASIKDAVSPTTFFAIQTGVNLATQTAKQFINYYVSDIGRRTGDSNYQAIVNRRIEQVTDVTGILGGALSGAAAGSVFGPVGIAIGAVFGAVSSGLNTGFKYAARERAYQHEMFEQSTSQAYNLARANYSALTGRMR